MTELSVYYEHRRVGQIEVHADGPSFVYAPEWLRTRGAFPLSFLMPLSPRRVEPALFLPWAANLLPEAESLRAIGLRLGAAPEDVIAILAEIGRDTAGALSIGQPGSSSSSGWQPVPDDDALERIINELPSKPFLVGEEGVSMSLAGVQSKLGVAIDSDRRICIPVDGTPSTHILKLDADRLFGGVQNEALCLTLARLCGLNAPIVTTGRAGTRSYLLVPRYDRIQQRDRWRRLHQEDFCQALGKPPSAKYESNATGVPGPTLAEMFALTRNAMRANDILALLDYVLFNILACNTDAHAKNYSIIISGRGLKIAPIYDVMCAAAWEGVTRNLAQKIAGKNRGEHLKLRHWRRFASETSLNAPRLVSRVEHLAEQILTHIDAAAEHVTAMPAGDHVMSPHFVKAIKTRARAIIHGLSESGSPTTPVKTQRKKAAPRKKVTSRRRRPKKTGTS